MEFEKKKPKQSRSKQLVEDVLFATKSLVETIDFSKLNTTKISEYTGISVGSFYQYFKNREGVFSTLIDKTLEENRKKIKEVAQNIPSCELEVYLDTLTENLFTHFLSQKGYLKSLIFYQFQLSKAEKIIDSRWKMAEILTQEFEARYPQMAHEENKQKFFFIICSSFGVIYLFSQVKELPISEEFIKKKIKEVTKHQICNF